MPNEILMIDPRLLHLPGERSSGADPGKLQRQISQHGRSLAGMPPIEVLRGTDGEYIIYNGVTRATRAAKLSPGSKVPIEVTDHWPQPVGHNPTVGDRLP